MRVEMEYDAQYQRPRRRQGRHRHPDPGRRPVRPAHAGVRRSGATMADGADIPLPDTAVPIELDRIYASLADLSVALGPERREQGRHARPPAPGVREGDERPGRARQRDAPQPLGGQRDVRQGQRATCSPPSPSWPSSPRCSGRTTGSCGRSCATSPACRPALVTERVEIERALNAVARSVGTVKTFVRDNREALVTDIEKLTRVVKNINSEQREPRHRAPGRTARDRQPRRRVQPGDRHHRLPDRPPGHLRRRRRPAVRHRPAVRPAPRQQGSRLHAVRAAPRTRRGPGRPRPPAPRPTGQRPRPTSTPPPRPSRSSTATPGPPAPSTT